MAFESRYMAKDFLYKLLKIESMDDVEDLIRNISAAMEPEDVELVEKKIMERKAKMK